MIQIQRNEISYTPYETGADGIRRREKVATRAVFPAPLKFRKAVQNEVQEINGYRVVVVDFFVCEDKTGMKLTTISHKDYPWALYLDISPGVWIEALKRSSYDARNWLLDKFASIPKGALEAFVERATGPQGE